MRCFQLNFVTVLFMFRDNTSSASSGLLFNLKRDEWTFGVFTSHRRTGRDVLNDVQLQRIKQESLAKIPEVSSEETRTFPYMRARAQPSNNVICFFKLSVREFLSILLYAFDLKVTWSLTGPAFVVTNMLPLQQSTSFDLRMAAPHQASKLFLKNLTATPAGAKLHRQ